MTAKKPRYNHGFSCNLSCNPQTLLKGLRGKKWQRGVPQLPPDLVFSTTSFHVSESWSQAQSLSTQGIQGSHSELKGPQLCILNFCGNMLVLDIYWMQELLAQAKFTVLILDCTTFLSTIPYLCEARFLSVAGIKTKQTNTSSRQKSRWDRK